MEIMPTIELAGWMQRGYTWMTVTELAKHIKVTTAQIRRWERKGKLPSRRIGKRIVFLLHEIDLLLPMIKRWLGRPQQIGISQSY